MELREVKAGHDGTWVAHPALVTVAMEIFNEHMPQPNQLSFVPECSVTAQDLLRTPVKGEITLHGLEENVEVCIFYVESWLRGNGCIPVNFKMEDAATAEISRAQVWQWVHHAASTSDGTKITPALVHNIAERATNKLLSATSAPKGGGKFRLAGRMVADMMTAPELDDFLTSVAYPHIVEISHCRL